MLKFEVKIIGLIILFLFTFVGVNQVYAATCNKSAPPSFYCPVDGEFVCGGQCKTQEEINIAQIQTGSCSDVNFSCDTCSCGTVITPPAPATTTWTLSGNNLYPTVLGNNVGIGTSSPDPAKKLEVVGDILINGNITVGNGKNINNVNVLFGKTGTDLFIKTNEGETNTIHYAANQHRFWNNGSNTLAILSNGNVGIANDTPNFLLEVGSQSFNSPAFLNLHSNLGNNSGIVFSQSGSPQWWIWRERNDNNSLIFGRDGSPLQDWVLKLDKSNDANFSRNLYVTNGEIKGKYLHITDSSASAWNGIAGTLNIGSDTKPTSAAKLKVTGQIEITGGFPGAGKVLTSDANGLATWATPASTTYTAGGGLNLTGNVFSAQTSTSLWNANKLQGRVISDVAPAIGQVLKWRGNDWYPGADDSMPSGSQGQTLRYYLDNQGNYDGWIADSNLFNNGTNVGIGMSTPDVNAPDVKLVVGSGYGDGNMVGINGASGKYVGTRISLAGSEKWFVGSNSADNFEIRREKTDPVMIIDKTNGNVGIGLMPNSEMEFSVDGDVFANRYIYFGGGATTDPAKAAGLLGFGPPVGDNPGAAILESQDHSNLILRSGKDRDIIFQNSDQGTLMVIKPAGNIGIGTTNPVSALHIATGVAPFLLQVGSNTFDGAAYVRVNSASGRYSGINFAENGTNQWWIFRDPTDSNSLNFGHSDSPATKVLTLKKDSDANFSRNLYVTNGEIKGKYLHANSTESGAISSISHILKVTGDVGIGLDSADVPTAKLDINGQIKIRTGAGANKVLTSDANGLASWTTLPAQTTYTAGAGLTLTGNAFSLTGITAGSATVGAVKYNGTTRTAGQFDGGTTAPSNTTRLNYDGNFYATNFYGNGSNLTNLDAGDISAGTLLVARGGTGIASYTTNNYIRASGATTLEQRTPDQVRADIGAGTGSGTVTSVGLSLLPTTIFSISGSPVTGSGTLTASLVNQTTNKVLASPSGSTGAPSFRALVTADIPNLDAGKITSGTFDIGWEMVTTTCGGTQGVYNCAVTCPTGKKIIGGGCQINSSTNNPITQSYPEEYNSNGWKTRWNCIMAYLGNLTAYAICANVK